MTDLIEVSYDQIKVEAANQLRAIELSSLDKYWKIGEVVEVFCRNASRNKYGERTIVTLATDLRELGLLEDVADPTRFLYWAKSIKEAYTKEALASMVDSGYTVYHAKLLLSLDPEQRAKIGDQIFEEDGTICSGAKLKSIVMSTLRADMRVAAEEAVKAVTAEEVKLPEKSETPVSPDTPGNPELPTPTPEPRAEAAAHTESSPSAADTPPNTLKTLRQVEKSATKILATIPDVFIAIRTVQQTGFDSERAQNNYNRTLAEMKTALRDILDPIQEVLREIESQDVQQS